MHRGLLGFLCAVERLVGRSEYPCNREIKERTRECGIRHQFNVRFKLRLSAGHYCCCDTRTSRSQLALQESST